MDGATTRVDTTMVAMTLDSHKVTGTRVSRSVVTPHTAVYKKGLLAFDAKAIISICWTDRLHILAAALCRITCGCSVVARHKGILCSDVACRVATTTMGSMALHPSMQAGGQGGVPAGVSLSGT